MEIWKSIPEFEGLYEASNFGEIRSVDRKVFSRGKLAKVNGRKLKPDINRCGYFAVKLSKHSKPKTFSVHRLIAITFLENKKSLPIVNHKDCDKTNNNPTNLEWCTAQFNNQHSVENGRLSKIKHSNKKLSLSQATEIRSKHEEGSSLKSLGKSYGVHCNTIRSIIRNITWKQ